MLKTRGEKTIWVVGGSDLAGQFYDAGLLDEMIVQIGSVTLGQGKPLFPRQTVGGSMRLISAQRMGAGFAEQSCEIAPLAPPQQESPLRDEEP